MRVNVQIYPSSNGPTRRSESSLLELPCGSGEQLVRWLGHAACLRLAYQRRDVPSKLVPYAVLDKDGAVLDANHVLREVVKDGDEVFVEYSSGPKAFQARWEGRPVTPDFEWSSEGVVLPPHDTWLSVLDLKAERLDLLVDKEYKDQHPDNLDSDLELVKELLVRHAGPLQACFVVYELSGNDKSAATVGRMNLSQFKQFCYSAGITKPTSKGVEKEMPSDRLDDIFTSVAASSQSLERKLDSTAASTMNLVDFLLALINVAYYHARFENEDMSTVTPLSAKFDNLLATFIAKNIYPDLSSRVDKVNASQTKNATLMLRKGRRLTEQTLDSCQMKRVKSATVQVELKHLASHMQTWKLLGKHFSFMELAAFVLFAKHKSSEVEAYELQPHPIKLDYDEFERVLLAMAFHMYRQQKSDMVFEEFLGEVMDSVYRVSGVLIELPND